MAQLVSVPVSEEASPCARPEARAASAALKFRTAFADITQLKRAEAERNRALASEQRLRARLEALDHASMAVSAALAAKSHASDEEVLWAIETHARAITGAESVRVELLGQPSSELGSSGLSTRVDGHALSVPIDYAGKKLGTLFVAQKRGGDPFEQADLEVLEMLVERVASALEVMRLNRIEAGERLRLRLLEATARELAGQLDGRTVLAAMSQVMQVVVPDFADLCAVHVIQDNVLQRISIFHRSQEDSQRLLRTAPRIERAEASSLLRQVLEQKKATWLPAQPDQAEDREVLRNLTAQLASESMIVAPLLARGRLLGLMTLAMIESTRR